MNYTISDVMNGRAPEFKFGSELRFMFEQWRNFRDEKLGSDGLFNKMIDRDFENRLSVYFPDGQIPDACFQGVKRTDSVAAAETARKPIAEKTTD